MEPSELDQLVRQKHKEANGMYQQQRDAARASVWSSIHAQIGKRTSRSLRWYHLAAAILVLLIPLGIVYSELQRTNQENMQALISQISQLQQEYQVQTEHLKSKNNELAALRSDFVKVQEQMKELEGGKLPVQTKKIVYVTDTVFIKQVEYITTAEDPLPAENMETAIEIEPDKASADAATPDERDDLIFLSQHRNKTSQKPESLKLQIGSLASRN